MFEIWLWSANIKYLTIGAYIHILQYKIVFIYMCNTSSYSPQQKLMNPANTMQKSSNATGGKQVINQNELHSATREQESFCNLKVRQKAVIGSIKETNNDITSVL